MGATTGIKAIGNYAGAATDNAACAVLLALIPNPDAGAGGNGASQGTGGSYLDEMSPACAAQLRVELLALQDAVDTTNTL
jgi:hypothetical protein